jgi:hypothetical protein
MGTVVLLAAAPCVPFEETLCLLGAAAATADAEEAAAVDAEAAACGSELAAVGGLDESLHPFSRAARVTSCVCRGSVDSAEVEGGSGSSGFV